jgi:hypothetical protein
MVSWGKLRSSRPDLADAGRQLLYRVGVGLGYLATVARDGAPRVHPFCPLITESDLFAFIVPSPKRNDLLRDQRYAVHSFPCPDNEDAFYLAGRAERVSDASILGAMVQQFLEERSQFRLSADDLADQLLFRFEIERCLLTRTTGHGDPQPQHTIWRADATK